MRGIGYLAGVDRRGVRIVLAVLLVAAVGLALAGRASAQNSEYLVTYAARACPAYTDVTANLARNDIQESLRDLGADTLYSSGEPISPAKEQQGQPNCVPLANWRFTLGTGYQSRAVSGSWGSLSKVTGAFDTSIVTRNSVPLLDVNGDSTGSRLSGAVTVALTSDQARLAGQYSGLWLQGGTVDDPVLDQVYPGAYGFAALRCAIDGLNGDNVETLQFPQGARHIFCFAYYVNPPPTSGTIIVRKQVTDPSATASQTFSYAGNISYTSDHTFNLSAAYQQPREISFVRGATGPNDPPWTFTEQPLAGWQLTGLTCTSASGMSTASTDLATGAASVTLAGSDTVTCTYSNRPIPPAGHLVLAKLSLGGTGTFPFSVTGPRRATQTLTTTRAGVPVAGKPLGLAPGSYRVTERLPRAGAAGRWAVIAVACNGAKRKASTSVSVTITAATGAFCLFTNRFTPAGSLQLHKVSFGGIGTALFGIRPMFGAPGAYLQRAQTRRVGIPVLATGSDTSRLPLGRYVVTESATVHPPGRNWIVETVLCDGRPVAASRGTVIVELTRHHPKVSCSYVNLLVRTVTKPPPLPPQPPPPPVSPVTPPGVPPGTAGPPPPESIGRLQRADRPNANLSVTKTESPAVANPGELVHYRVVVVNHGPDTAENVVATELGAPGTTPLHVHTSRGTCVGQRPARCRIGQLAPGQSAVMTVTVRARTLGRHINRVGVVSSTHDPRLADNIASATLVVRPAPVPTVTG